MCPNASGFAWILFTPQATLFTDHDKQVITHFFSPNPSENNTNAGVMPDGTIRARWQDSRDTSTVWAMAIAASSDAAFVAPDALPWLLLDVAGAQDGPTGGHRLTSTVHSAAEHRRRNRAFNRLCAGNRRRQEGIGPYAADYLFYN